MPPGAAAELPRAQHHVLGVVADGDALAYFVYGMVHFEDDADSPSKVQTLKMERTPEGWRAISIYFAGHGNVGMQIWELDSEPPAAETPANRPELSCIGLIEPPWQSFSVRVDSGFAHTEDASLTFDPLPCQPAV